MVELMGIVARSIIISGSATLLAASWSIPLAYYLGRRGRIGVVKSVLEALVGTPTVLIGLLLYMLFCNTCPLGMAGILYTPYAIMIGEALLITPLVTAVALYEVSKTWRSYGELAYTLGASDQQVMEAVLKYSLPGVMGGLFMGFSRAIGELGVALIVGGNIKGYTRVMTTAIALEVSRGEYEAAIILGLLLLLIMLGIVLGVKMIGRGEED